MGVGGSEKMRAELGQKEEGVREILWGGGGGGSIAALLSHFSPT